MRYLLTASLIALWIQGTTQQNVKLYSEQSPDGFSVYADNEEYCPVSVALDYDLTNLRPPDKHENIIVIPARSHRFRIADLAMIRRGRTSGLRYAIRANYGDHHLRSDEHDVVYHLPFRQGVSFAIGQGYNGSFSHRNENALDFNMPVGTEIYAARGGVVCKVVEDNNRSCPEQECYKYNNYIRVYHSDGTFAEYAHIKKDGALVNEGDKITTGQLIGYSGNVGWSSGPHLHFMVYRQRLDRRETLKTRFLIRVDAPTEYLVEKKTYTRAYE